LDFIWLAGLGVLLQLAGVALGAMEIRSTRRATTGFLRRGRKLYASGGALALSGSDARLTKRGQQVEPTVEERLAALEGAVSDLRGNLRKLAQDQRAAWRSDMAAVVRTQEKKDSDLVAELDTFAQELGAGRGRRVAAVVFLTLGLALQGASIMLDALVA